MAHALGPKFRERFAVLVRKRGTGNAWIEWRPPAATFDAAVEQLREALDLRGEAKIVRRVERVEGA
jgi:hypothetical protein